ncbi:MAG: hypothetical protein EZS28_020035 [Streblomastix strix]|uniref:Tc1-like transposase DDE domain-containing protein n=1 Tax=Streblomastix strix TaxID=222440 RepID=A0A5J4VQ18_9EUKA|nr:MAG: hypothetical protein EZS28_020035 [Streblomastix strix]
MVRGVATSKVNIVEVFRSKKKRKLLATISRHTGILESTVKDILRRKTFAIKSGRTPQMGGRDRRRVKNFAKRNRKLQLRCIGKQACLNVSPRTIDWNKMVATDEKKFHQDVPDGYEYYQYAVDKEKIGVRYSVDYHRKRGVMVWMAANREDILHEEKVDEKINSDIYCEMLGNDTIASIHLKNGDDFLLFQDNVPAHRANFTIQFLEKHNIVHLQFPALSPDLNIMEN